jgi:hypothetical protein
MGGQAVSHGVKRQGPQEKSGVEPENSPSAANRAKRIFRGDSLCLKRSTVHLRVAMATAPILISCGHGALCRPAAGRQRAFAEPDGVSISDSTHLPQEGGSAKLLWQLLSGEGDEH